MGSCIGHKRQERLYFDSHSHQDPNSAKQLPPPASPHFQTNEPIVASPHDTRPRGAFLKETVEMKRNPKQKDSTDLTGKTINLQKRDSLIKKDGSEIESRLQRLLENDRTMSSLYLMIKTKLREEQCQV